jgi:hypothetical protein
MEVKNKPVRLAFVADVHIGNHRRFGGEKKVGVNQRCELILGTLARAVKEAHREDSSALFVCGDLFDTAHPEPQVIARTIDALKSTTMPVIVIPGNHDQNTHYRGDNSLAPLARVLGINVLDEPAILCFGSDLDTLDVFSYVEVWCAPYRSGQGAEWLPATVEYLSTVSQQAPNLRPAHRVLVTHLGVKDEHTPVWLKDSHDSISSAQLMELLCKYDIDCAFTGNWHDPRQWKNGTNDARHALIHQLGTLVPTGFDNPGVHNYGAVALYNPSGPQCGEFEAITLHIPGPRFVTATTRGEVSAVVGKTGEHSLFLRWITETLQEYECALTGIESMKAQRLIIDGCAELDREGPEKQARAAAVAAQSAETFAEALATFVRGMPLDEGVDREEVLSRARAYLARDAK